MIQPSPEAVDAALLELGIGKAAKPAVAKALSAAYAIDMVGPRRLKRPRTRKGRSWR